MLNRISKFAQKKLKSSFLRGVLVLGSGTMLSQVILILVTPLLTRIYTPEQYGVYAILLAITIPLSVVSCLRYEQAIMLPEDRDSAEYVLFLSLVVALITSFISVVFITVFKEDVLNLANIEAIGNWIYFLPVVVLIQGIYLSFRMWAIRQKDFVLVTKSSLSQTIFQSVLQVSIGVIEKTSVDGLLIGQLVGRIVAMSIISFKTCTNLKCIIFKKKTITLLLAMAKRYKNFPIYVTAGNFMVSVSQQSVVLVVGAFFSAKEAGLYFLTMSILSLPLKFIGSAIGDVYFQKIASEKTGDIAKESTIRLTRALILFSLPIFICLAFVAPQLFGIIFGDNWVESGEYAKILAIMLMFRFVASPLSVSFTVYEKQKMALVWQVVYFIVTISAVLLGAYLDSMELALIFLSVTGTAMYIIMFHLSLNFNGVKIYDLLRPN